MKQFCFIDYLSFTWVPELILPYRKLARLNNQTFKQFVSDYHDKGQPLNIGEMEENMVDSLKTFFMRSNDIFKECDLSREELDEAFSLRKRLGGIFGYSECWDILIDTTTVGLCATGGTAGTCYISFTGKGCAMLNMEKIQELIRVLPEIKITRVDIALDDHHGITSYNHAFDAYVDRQFVTRGLPPKCNIHASGGELSDRGEVLFKGGRTFEVGNRASGKLYRGYEKGRQQGNPDSEWFRHEVELRSVNREIPLYVLTEPDQYFSGFYPYLSHVLDIVSGHLKSATVIPCKKTKRYKQQAKIVMQNCIDNVRRNAGGLVNVMRFIGMSDAEIVERLIRDSIPVKLRQVNLPPFKSELQPCH